MPKPGFERYISRFLIFNWKLVFADNSKLIGPKVFLKNHHTDRFLTKTEKPADELQYQTLACVGGRLSIKLKSGIKYSDAVDANGIFLSGSE